MNKIEKIAILVNDTKESAVNKVFEIKKVLSEADIGVLLFDKYAQSENEIRAYQEKVKDASLVISIGGDGTLLHALRITLPFEIPVLPVYNGSLGFISETTLSESLEILKEFIKNDAKTYQVEKRHLLDVYLTRKEETEHFCAINEAVILKGGYPRLSPFELSIDGEFMSSIKGDGIIVSSATGSTAYALSAGGPIIDPAFNSIVVVPIAPHSLTFRPLVLSGDRSVCVSVSAGEALMYFSVDGQDSLTMCSGDKMEVKTSEKCFYLLKLKNRSFYKILKDKLGFGK